MNFLRQICIVIGCLAAIAAHGQSFMEQPDFIKANSIWLFGENAGLDFNSGAPVTINSAGYAPFFGTATLASPTTGELSFYTDGINCYNKDRVIMPNGANLLPGAFPDAGFQGVCIVPFVSDPNRYYVFHMEGVHRESASGMPGAGYPCYNLYYSIVDLTLDGGKGDVVAGSKSILIDSILTQSIIAVPGDDCDIWLLAHSTSDPNFFAHPYFKAFHITSAGLNTTPVVSTIVDSWIATAFPPPPVTMGAPIPHAYGACHMSISPNRKMIALSALSADFGGLYVDGPLGPVTNFNSPPMDMTSNNPGTTIAQHTAGLLGYQFNPATGIVSNEIFIRNLGTVTNATFSPDNNKLYATLVGPVNQMATVSYISGSAISQYDVSLWDSTAIVASKFDVYKSPALNDGVYFRLRAFKDKIYFQCYDDPYHLGVINQPNLAGNAAGYQDSLMPYGPGALNGGNFPNQVVFPLKETISSQRDTVICGAMEQMFLQAPAGSENQVWDNGSTGNTRLITARGKYWVRYNKENKCINYVDTITVKGSNGNHASIDYDSTNCNGAVTLNSRHTGDEYLWSNGARQQSTTVNVSGKYWLRVKKEGCYSTDTVEVRVCECFVHIPSAFSPNGDGLNDLFLPVLSADCATIKPYTLSIYNRYGERIFNTIDPGRGWDGKYANGEHADVGTYFFRVSYHSTENRKEQHKNGDLTLIR